VLLLITHPPDPRPALVVETVARIDETAMGQLKERMLGLSCPNGLLFDGNHCAIIRDTYTSLEVASLVEDSRVATDALLARVPAAGRTVDQRVLDWLRSMAASWNSALPTEGDVAIPFITDIVPAVSGSQVRQVA
jgi:hypothetical protein